MAAKKRVEPCQQISCITVPIIDDSIVEKDENFIVKLERGPNMDPRITLEDSRVNITIFDNDSMWIDMIL